MLVIGEIDTIFFYRKHAYILPTIKKKKREREKERERERITFQKHPQNFFKKN